MFVRDQNLARYLGNIYCVWKCKKNGYREFDHSGTLINYNYISNYNYASRLVTSVYRAVTCLTKADYFSLYTLFIYLYLISYKTVANSCNVNRRAKYSKWRNSRNQIWSVFLCIQTKYLEGLIKLLKNDINKVFDISAIEHFFRVYITSSKHEECWENSRQLSQPSVAKVL